MEKHHLKALPNKSQPDRHWRQRNLFVSSVWFNESIWIGLLRGNIRQSILPRLILVVVNGRVLIALSNDK